MQIGPGYDKCFQFVSSHARHTPTSPASEQTSQHPLAITISRQSGSGAHRVASCLAAYLQSLTQQDAPPWAVFDRNLVEKVLQDHNLPARLARFMPEDRVPELADAFDELLGVHPPVWKLVQQTVETIRFLADRGNAILIGRGAHIATGDMSHVFHVRLVGSLEKRIEHVRELRGVSKVEALALIRQEDRGRERYLKKYFGKDLHDPLSYHLIVNTDYVPYESAARLIGDAALEYHRQMSARPLDSVRPQPGVAALSVTKPAVG